SHTVYDHTSVLTTIKNWVKVKFNKDLRPFKTYQSDGVTYDPNPRIAVAKDITDCLDPDYRGQGRAMPKMPPIGIKEADALASMYLNEGQSGFAEAYGMDQPDVRGKMEACKQVMEQMYRLGAIDIG